MDDYVRSVASNGGAAGEIDKAKQLLDSGAITQTEYEAIKAKAWRRPRGASEDGRHPKRVMSAQRRRVSCHGRTRQDRGERRGG
jgi:hypothetical protein